MHCINSDNCLLLVVECLIFKVFKFFVEIMEIIEYNNQFKRIYKKYQYRNFKSPH